MAFKRMSLNMESTRVSSCYILYWSVCVCIICWWCHVVDDKYVSHTIANIHIRRYPQHVYTKGIHQGASSKCSEPCG
jgi:hypothetical protein